MTKQLVKPKPPPTGRLVSYICTFWDSKSSKYIKREIRAAKVVDLGVICFKKYNAYPVDVIKKPFEQKPNLTQTLKDHPGLKSLSKQLSKKKG